VLRVEFDLQDVYIPLLSFIALGLGKYAICNILGKKEKAVYILEKYLLCYC